MSGKKARAARRVAALTPERGALPRAPGGLRPTWRAWMVGLGVISVIAGSFVLPDVLDGQPATISHPGMAAALAPGTGLPAGSPAPTFTERDVTTGRAITSASIRGRRTLLFFSEGVMCQACFEQIKGLERIGAELGGRGIQLVSITPDSAADLRRAVSQYGITTPMIADDDRDMSTAFNTLGQGMHGDTPGHAFALVRNGTVVWYRDYWLGSSPSMYVDPDQLLRDLQL